MSTDNDFVVFVDDDTFTITADDDGLELLIEHVNVDEYAAALVAQEAAEAAADAAEAALASIVASAAPCGRLTLITDTPVMSSDVAGATTVYYTPCAGHRSVTIYDGTRWVPRDISQLSQATTDTTKAPAAVANNSNYDQFVGWTGSAGALYRAPAWTSDTARGTGAGTTELELFQGVYVNKYDIVNGLGAVVLAARTGVYVGTIRSNGTATIDWKIGTSAAGGGEARLCVWNAYNRKEVAAGVTDSTASWNYTSATIRSADNSATNRVSFVVGLQEDRIDASVLNRPTLTAAGAGIGYYGLALDATNATNKKGGVLAVANTASTSGTVRNIYAPQIGFHFIQATEVGDGSNATTFVGLSEQGLFVTLPM
jgi:hypothetical protein